MRTLIAALQISLDGYIEGPEAEQDWVDSWADAIQLIPDVDMFLLGGRMYPDYGDYWGSIHSKPESVPPSQERLPSKSEVAYARLAASTPHVVLSTTLQSVEWPSAKVVRSIDDIRMLKSQQGKNTYVVGGAALVKNLLDAGLIDELKLIVHPLLLGGGKALFQGVQRRPLNFVRGEQGASGRMVLTYSPSYR